MEVLCQNPLKVTFLQQFLLPECVVVIFIYHPVMFVSVCPFGWLPSLTNSFWWYFKGVSLVPASINLTRTMLNSPQFAWPDGWKPLFPYSCHSGNCLAWTQAPYAVQCSSCVVWRGGCPACSLKWAKICAQASEIVIWFVFALCGIFVFLTVVLQSLILLLWIIQSWKVDWWWLCCSIESGRAYSSRELSTKHTTSSY